MVQETRPRSWRAMKVFLLGATGFIGSRVMERLLEDGHEVVALVRDPTTVAARERLTVLKGDVAVRRTYRGQLFQCQASINCVGLLRERINHPGERYARVVVQGTESWVEEAREAGVKHLVYVSANGAAAQGTKYQRTKWLAEQAVQRAGPAWTIFRPSFVIGPGGFVAQVLGLLKLRLLPVFGKQTYLASPVDRDDLVNAIVASLRTPKARNRLFHVGGPEDVTYEHMVTTIRDAARIRATVFRLPKFMGYAMTACLGWLPFFPATLENLRMLLKGNVVSEDAWMDAFQADPTFFEPAVKKSVRLLKDQN
jgi:NADH dehydrogenase